MQVHGLGARQGETAFAFLVFRLQRAASRDEVIALIRHVASVIPDAEAVIAQLPADPEPMKIVGMPWVPPEAGHAVDAQRRLIEASASRGVAEAWFFQTGTSLPSVYEDDDDDDDDDEVPLTRRPLTRAETTDDVRGRADDDWGATGWSNQASGEMDDDATQALAIDDDDDEHEDPPTGPRGVLGARAASVSDAGDDGVAWSHGAPPMVSAVRFPVDGYPAILDELDGEDFGIAFKLSGRAVPGERTVLLGLHALWLSPYGGRYRNAAVTIDSVHHAAHLWVDRFAVPSSAEEQVHHLLWVLSKLDEVIPVVHARFAGATMAQKYSGRMGETGEPFVLGGNPLVAVHAEGGDAAVDAWIARPSEWSEAEIAQMLRELAIDLVTTPDDDGGETGDLALDDVDEPASDGDDDDAGEDRGRLIARHAGEVLAARAAAGLLDARVAAQLRPLLAIQDRHAHRRCAVVEILGGLRDGGSVAALCQVVDESPLRGKELLVKTATALGAIGDPAAIPALTKLVTAPGEHNDAPRAAAADALATCLAATPEPRDVGDEVLLALLSPIQQRDDADDNTRLHFAYGRLAQVLTPARREVARRRLEETTTARDDLTPTLARQIALLLARGGGLDAPAASALRPLVHQALTALDDNHERTLHRIRAVLRIAADLPELVDPEDLVWLTRWSEPDVRAQAHALRERLGSPLAPAAVFDRRTARALDATQLVQLIGEPHVVGRAALVAEAGRRSLASARGAILAAAHAVIGNVRPGGANLLDPDARLLEAAITALRSGPLDPDVIALFSKWEALQELPLDDDDDDDDVN